MSTVIVIDTIGDSLAAIRTAAVAAGWEVAGDSAKTADAVVLAIDANGLDKALKGVEQARRAGAAVAVVADIGRASWAKVFGRNEASEVDALFGRPVDGAALFRRLDGIVGARASVRKKATSGMAAILDRAIQNEESAAAFYKQAAACSSDKGTRDALEGLMRDEFDHKRLIEEFKSGARPLPEGRTSGGSLLEGLGAPDFTPDLSSADAFLLAAKKEKMAVEFYENWAALYSSGPQRELLLSLAEVERRHKEKVENMFTNAAFPEAW